MKTAIQNDNEYFICFKNVIHLLKLFAVFPFIRFNEKTKLGRLFSSILTIISLAAYAWVNAREEIYLYNFSYEELGEFSLVNAIRFVVQAVLRTLILTFPLFTWSKNDKLRDYWHSWMIFQIKIEKLTKTRFKSSTQNQIHGFFLFMTISMMLICIILIITQQRSIASLVVNPFTAFYISHALAYVTAYWTANNIFITGVAKKITHLMRQALRKGNVADLNRLVYLWVMLCDLNDQFIDIHSITFLIIFSANIINGVLSIFLAVTFFVYLDDKNFGLLYISATVVFMIGVAIFCESANLVVDQMVHKMKNVLLGEKITTKKKNMIPVILLFLHTVETRKPKMTFRGYITVDRSIVTSTLAAAINFLIVLRQFTAG